MNTCGKIIMYEKCLEGLDEAPLVDPHTSTALIRQLIIIVTVDY